MRVGNSGGSRPAPPPKPAAKRSKPLMPKPKQNAAITRAKPQAKKRTSSIVARTAHQHLAKALQHPQLLDPGPVPGTPSWVPLDATHSDSLREILHLYPSWDSPVNHSHYTPPVQPAGSLKVKFSAERFRHPRSQSFKQRSTAHDAWQTNYWSPIYKQNRGLV